MSTSFSVLSGPGALASVEVNLLKAQRVEHAGKCGAGILLSGIQNAIRQRGLLKVVFGLLPDFALQIGIDGHQQTGLTRIDASLRIVQAGRKQLWLRNMQ